MRGVAVGGRELHSELATVVVAGVVVGVLQEVGPSEHLQSSAHCQVLGLDEVLGVGLPGLVEGETARELLALEGHWEGVLA